MLIDTHCHINMMIKITESIEFNQEECQKAQEILEKARTAGVTSVICIGTDVKSSYQSVDLASTFSPVFATVGIHPNDATAFWQDDIKELKRMLEKDRNGLIVGVGECGIDKHYPGYDINMQKSAFKAQIELALEYNKAIVVHTRDAYEETLECLEAFKGEPLLGTIHCFSEDLAFATRAKALGFVLGIGGPVTYPKNTLLRSVVEAVGIEHIVLETDAPFLPPQVIRGKTNSPDQIYTIAQYISELLKISFDEVSSKTSQNAQRIFGLQKQGT